MGKYFSLLDLSDQESDVTTDYVGSCSCYPRAQDYLEKEGSWSKSVIFVTETALYTTI